ncbi:DUF3970 family protein [Bacillus cereus group sp. BceL293]|uniref:DUF3970 family protein n=1 Tax=Bacillus cereus group sp. BceL293 TaxID=3444992 RepID=UPI003F23900D
MADIRITSLPSKVKGIVAALEDQFEIISVSKEYENRNSKEVRVYVKIDQKEGSDDGNN